MGMLDRWPRSNLAKASRLESGGTHRFRCFVCASVVEERISSADGALVLVDSVRAARKQKPCTARAAFPAGSSGDGFLHRQRSVAQNTLAKGDFEDALELAWLRLLWRTR